MSTRPRRELIINEDLPRFLRKTAAIIFVLSIAIGVITGLTIKFNSEFNTVLLFYWLAYGALGAFVLYVVAGFAELQVTQSKLQMQICDYLDELKTSISVKNTSIELITSKLNLIRSDNECEKNVDLAEECTSLPSIVKEAEVNNIDNSQAIKIALDEGNTIRCSKCGMVQRSNRTVCQSCGVKFS